MEVINRLSQGIEEIAKLYQNTEIQYTCKNCTETNEDISQTYTIGVYQLNNEKKNIISNKLMELDFNNRIIPSIKIIDVGKNKQINCNPPISSGFNGGVSNLYYDEDNYYSFITSLHLFKNPNNYFLYNRNEYSVSLDDHCLELDLGIFRINKNIINISNFCKIELENIKCSNQISIYHEEGSGTSKILATDVCLFTYDSNGTLVVVNKNLIACSICLLNGSITSMIKPGYSGSSVVSSNNAFIHGIATAINIKAELCFFSDLTKWNLLNQKNLYYISK